MLKQIAGIGKNFRSNYGKTSKTEDSCQKIMAKDARLVIYIATLTNHDKTYGWNSEKSPSIAIFSIFLSKKNVFIGLFFETRLDNLFDFAPKLQNFTVQARKIYPKQKNFLRKIFSCKLFFW